MEFTLFYRGSLKANGGVADKQRIRRVIHSQLATLFSNNHLMAYVPFPYPIGKNSICFPTIKTGGFSFVSIVCEKHCLAGKLAITFLRPEPPGAIITQGGDIDNRIKTLLDALRVPKNASELPNGDVPTATEKPFFCLLEDDNLVTEIAVKADTLLDSKDKNEVVLLIHVTVKKLSPPLS